MKIYCKKEDFNKFTECLKYGDCPEGAEDNNEYCLEKCQYYIFNIEMIEIDNEHIHIEGINIEELKVCLYKTFYNFLSCGMVKKGEDCEKCRFYEENLIQK